MRARARIEDAKVVCPYCDATGAPSIVQDAVMFWHNAKLDIEGESVYVDLADDEYCLENYEIETRNTRLRCPSCGQDFDPPQGFGIDFEC